MSSLLHDITLSLNNRIYQRKAEEYIKDLKNHASLVQLSDITLYEQEIRKPLKLNMTRKEIE